MKPTFHAHAVNGPFEDPSVFIRIMREKRALLFDLGCLDRFDFGNLSKVSDVFVTHTHIDHFIGFDLLLRAVLKRDTPLRIFGPENIISCVEGKLKGYTWNLIKHYPIKIDVFEVAKNSLRHSGFYAQNSFQRLDYSPCFFDEILLDEPSFKVKGVVLSHQIPVMAYSIEEEFHININKEILDDMGLPVGPWLSDFKRAMRRNASEETIFEVGGKAFALKDLQKIAAITRGQKISYVVDIAPTDENIEKVIRFVKGSDILFCEAYFLEKDKDRAVERHHLTAALAGKVAKEAGVGNLRIMHFSPKYRDSADELYNEAMKEFKGD